MSRDPDYGINISLRKQGYRIEIKYIDSSNAEPAVSLPMVFAYIYGFEVRSSI